MSKIAKCDRCGKTEPIPNNLSVAKGWNPVSFQTQGYRTSYYDICPECSKLLGIESRDQVDNLGDKILDIFYEIAEEVTSNG